MRKLGLVVAVCLLAGCGDCKSAGSVNAPGSVIDSAQFARIRALEARVETLEDWAQRKGMEYGRIK